MRKVLEDVARQDDVELTRSRAASGSGFEMSSTMARSAKRLAKRTASASTSTATTRHPSSFSARVMCPAAHPSSRTSLSRPTSLSCNACELFGSEGLTSVKYLFPTPGLVEAGSATRGLR